jgi:hypothetical protein
MKKLLQYLALAASAVFLLSGCASLNPPKNQAPAAEMTSDYMVLVYQGTGKNFNPNPTITLEEHDDLGNFNKYCTAQAQKLEGRGSEMVSQGALYGALQGVFTAFGARWGFGSMASPNQYFKYAGASGFGGGLANGSITFSEARRMLEGYCRTLMAYKADELEGKLKRIVVAPVYTGSAPMPVVSNAPAPSYPNAGAPRMPPPQ